MSVTKSHRLPSLINPYLGMIGPSDSFFSNTNKYIFFKVMSHVISDVATPSRPGSPPALQAKAALEPPPRPKPGAAPQKASASQVKEQQDPGFGGSAGACVSLWTKGIVLVAVWPEMEMDHGYRQTAPPAWARKKGRGCRAGVPRH